MLETCASMTFPDFRRWKNGARVILQKFPRKSI